MRTPLAAVVPLLALTGCFYAPPPPGGLGALDVVEPPQDTGDVGTRTLDVIQPTDGAHWTLSRQEASARAWEGATIEWLVDDEVVGTGPEPDLELPEGEHTLRVRASDGEETVRQPIDIIVHCTEYDLWVGAGSRTCYEKTSTIRASADTWVRDETPHGDEARLMLYAGRSEAFVRFDLDDVDPDWEITDVALVMWSADGYAHGGRGWTDIAFVGDDDWTEDMTWSERPSASERLSSWFLWYDGSSWDQQSTLHNPAFEARFDGELAGDGQLSLQLYSEGYDVEFRARESGDDDQVPMLLVRHIVGSPEPGFGDVPGNEATIVEDEGGRRWSDGSVAASCWDYRTPLISTHSYDGDTGSGVYVVQPDDEPFAVYCDMETDGGGWTLVDNDAEPEASFDERPVGAVTDLSETSGASLPAYAWHPEPQLLCRSSHSLASDDYVVLDALRVQDGLENPALGYPTGHLPEYRWSNGFSIADDNGLNFGDGLRFKVTPDNPMFRAQTDEGVLCACNDAGQKSGIGEVVDATQSTCSVWVR